MSDRMIGFLAVVCLFAMLLAAFPFYVYNKNFRRCVALENGLNLGYNAVFDLRSPYFLPVVTAKLPNGKPLANSDIWTVYISDTTLYGMALGDKRASSYWLAWRADTGLVLWHQDQKLYEKLKAEAGEINVGIGTGLYNTGAVMQMMQDQLGYTEHWCRTRLVTW